MNLNYSLELTQSQKLIMTTELKQSLEILNMNKSELEDEIKKQSEENPLLELERVDDTNWEEYIKYMDKYKSVTQSEFYYNEDNDINLENIIKYKENLYEHLHLQINLYRLKNEELEVCKYIIDSLDEDGYLRVDSNEITENLNIDKEFFTNCLNIVQKLEPSGVGATTLEECLIIQVRDNGTQNKLLEDIISNDLKLIASNKYKEISKKYKISLQECIDLISIIKTLNPKPGANLSIEKNIYVQPDVVVEKINDEFVIYSSKSNNYNMKINNFYKEILKNSKSDNEAKEFITSKLNSAKDLLKSIESRKNTILKIAREIVSLQEEFFNKGVKHIKPMRMKDIAEKLGFHESTISRGVNGKYMLTPYGLFEFKYFFSSSLETESDESVSSISIKKIIEEKIKGENKKKPLSDDKIAKELNQEGINIARRTIAKYREELNIPSSSKRKEY